MKCSKTFASSSICFTLVCFTLIAPCTRGGLVISAAVETNGEPEGIAITGEVIADHADPDVPDPYTVLAFDEDALSFTDRDHEYNGATVAGLPEFLVGGDYIMTANDARGTANYTLDVTTAVPCNLYLLRDNRSEATLPAWFSDGQGIDFSDTGFDVGMDEGGLPAGTVGPGVGINQTLSVYLASDQNAGGTTELVPGTYQLLASETAGRNMYGVVAVNIDLSIPIRDFYANPTTISAGEAVTLNWTISSNATSAMITPDVGDILPMTDSIGGGATVVSPTVSTNYTLTVESPGGTNSVEAAVTVRLIEAFTRDTQLTTPGGDVVLNWEVRPDATVSIDGLGDMAGNTDTNGMGQVTVNPIATQSYILRASGSSGAELEQADLSVYVVPTNGVIVGLIDIGGTDGTPDPEALGGAQVGAGPDQTNGANLPTFSLTTRLGDPIGVTIDNLDPTGAAVGNMDWRWRGAAPGDALTHTLEDICKNNAGMIRVSLSGLPSGEYTATSFHFDPGFSQCEAINILVTDMNGTAMSVSPPFGNASTAPVVDAGQLTTDLADIHGVTYPLATDGFEDVVFYYDGRSAAETEVPIGGLVLVRTGDIVALDTITGFVAEPSVISFGETVDLRWLIASNATAASIDQGIGSVLTATGADGVGSNTVMPAVTTTYTLSVSAPASNDTAQAIITVRMLDDFAADFALINEGDPVTLSWQVRPDATVTISGVGDVTADTDVNGIGSKVIYPEASALYTLTAESGVEMDQATLAVAVMPSGELFALIDFGDSGGQPEAGASMDTSGNQQIGNTADGTNLVPVTMIAADGQNFTVAVDALDPSGTAVGAIDWRDRGDTGADPLTRLAEDFMKNNQGILRVVIGGLPEGVYNIVSYHIDPPNSQSEEIKVLVTDADGVAVERDAVGDASFPGHPSNVGAPGTAGLTTAVVLEHFIAFKVRSDGTNDVIIYFDARNAPLDDEAPLNGLEIQMGEDDRLRLFNVVFDAATRDFSFDFNAETGAVYAVVSGSDLAAFPDATNAMVTADEEVEHVVLPGIPDAVKRRHYRVRQESPAP